MASRKEYEMMFQLNAQLGSSYSSTFKSAQSTLVSMQKEIQSINSIQSDISSYEKQQGAVEATGKRIQVYQQQLENIQKEMDETGVYSSKLANAQLDKQQQIEKANIKLDEQTQKLNKMGSALNEAKIDTDNLAQESAKLTEQVNKLKKEQEEAADSAGSFGSTASAAFDAAGQALIAAGIATALGKIADYFGECIEASMEFESAMTGVAKTTDMSDAELASMAEEFKQMSTVIPLAASEIAEIAESAGQLGIAKDDILAFTEVMANLGVATNLTSTEAATQLAKFANITQMSAANYENLGSTVVALGNNLATTEADIVNMAMRLAAAGEQAGMTEADIISISGALSSLGLESQAGGSSFSKAISQMQTAVETGSDSLEDFANVAGMSVDEFSRAFEEDATSALVSFTQGLADTERLGASATVLLEEMGIKELRMSDALKRAASSGDLFNEAIALGNAAWEENTALTAEAALRYGTTESQLSMMQNAYSNLQVAIGDVFTPTLQELYSVATAVMGPGTSFIQEHPALIKAFTAFAGIIGVAVTALTAYVAIAKVAKTVSQLLTAAIPGVNVIMGVVTAVAALTAGIMLWNEATKGQVDETWELTAVSRSQHKELQELQAEYEAVCDTMGDTSYEAQSLKWKIDDLTGEYENQMQTMDDYIAAHDAVMQSYTDMAAAQSVSRAGIESEYQSTAALIGKLEELTSSGNASQNEQAILAIIDKLNETLPDLALSYDDVTGSSETFIETVRASAEALAEQQKLQADWADYVERVENRSVLEATMKADQENLKILQAECDEAKAAYDDAYKYYAKVDPTGMMGSVYTADAAATYDAANEDLAAITVKLDEATAAYNENEEAIANIEDGFREYQEALDAAAASIEVVELSEEELAEAQRVLTVATGAVEDGFLTAERAAEYYGVSVDDINALMEENAAKASLIEMGLAGLEAGYWSMEEAAAALGIDINELNQAFNDQVYPEQIAEMIEEIEALGEAYTAAYDAALSSIQGQYNLWDKADKVVAQSTGTMNSALESQISYWQNYNANLDSLSSRSTGIDGLAEMVSAYAASGGEDAVNAIAGLASATDEQLVAMVGNYQELQAEQDETAKSLAELKTGFEEDMALMQKELEDKIAEMDMSNEAAEKGRLTIEGFVEGAEGQLPAVVAAYTRIGQAAMNAMDKTLDIHSPSREMEWRAEMTWAGYINQTEAMKEEVAAAMSGNMTAGTEAIAAEQAYIVALAPQLMERLAAVSGVNAISADPGSSSGGYGDRQPVSVHLTIEMPANATPETAEALRQSGEEIREIVRDVMEDIENDRKRNDFR